MEKFPDTFKFTEFKKLPKSLLDIRPDHRFFELISKAIADQVEDSPCTVNSERLSHVPVEAQFIYWLWRFYCEANRDGLEVFVLSWLGQHTQPIHEALTGVGALDLASLLEAAIPLARDDHAEFLRLPDQSWFNKFQPNPNYPSFRSIDDKAFSLIRNLSYQVASYARDNKDKLFQ